jgi:glycosyltransferase involved in cell wall biosynthesis
VHRPGDLLRWYVLEGRSSPADRAGWAALANAELAPGVVEPGHFLARARAVLAPTRFEVHPLLLVEAAVRGIPIVCTDLPSTRCAAAGCATYVPMSAPAEAWEAALRRALGHPTPRLRLRPYAQVVRKTLDKLQPARAA